VCVCVCFITFTDNLSRYGYMYLMKYKSKLLERLKKFINEVKIKIKIERVSRSFNQIKVKNT
jgi:hypothetical protein